MNRLVMVLPTMGFGRFSENWASWKMYQHYEAIRAVVVPGRTPLTAAYQDGYERAVAQYQPEILGFVHDDVTCLDPGWYEKVMREFEDPTVGLVGFGGSVAHGNPFINNMPYSWELVGRCGDFMSAMVNAEQHGSRITEPKEASVLDGFAMFVRRQILDNSPYGGWPLETPIAYWCYDYWLSCETRRQGFRVRVVPVACEHTCPSEYRAYVVNENCQEAHKWLYENYRDTFPAMVVNNA